MDTFSELDGEDRTRHEIGANNPPEPIDLTALKEKVEERIGVANKWITERPTLTDADMADKANGFKTQLAELKQALDKQRRAAKKPHEDAEAAIDAAFNPMIDLVKRAYDAISAKITAFLQEQQRLADEERRRQADEARKKREEAEAAAARAREEAQRVGGNALQAEQEAEAAARLASLAEKQAAKPVRVQLRGDHTSKAVGLRATWHAEVTDETAALRHYAKNRVVRAAALKAALEVATAEAKLAKDADAAPPGFRFFSTSKAA